MLFLWNHYRVLIYNGRSIDQIDYGTLKLSRIDWEHNSVTFSTENEYDTTEEPWRKLIKKNN